MLRTGVFAALALALSAAPLQALRLKSKTSSALQNETEGGNSTYVPAMQYEGYEEDWQTEWKKEAKVGSKTHEEYPHWKETVTDAWMDNSYNRYNPKDYTDSQSDGKRSKAPY